MIIDAKDQIMGRIAVVAAKQALLNQSVSVINCEYAVISGKEVATFAKYKRIRDMGVPRKGPFLARMPDRFLRRIIRGMVPMDKPRGKEAYKRIMCYIGTPDEFKGKETYKVPGASAEKLPTTDKTTVGAVCKHLGASWNE